MYFSIDPHRSVLVKDQKEQFLHVRVSAKPDRPEGVHNRPQINVATALDRSGSMGGEKLQHAKDAEKFLVRNMKDDDCFGLVSFDSNIVVEVPIDKIISKEIVNKKIDSIYVGGSTNISDALLKCMEQLSSLKDKKDNAVNRIILLSDGDANVGLTGDSLIKRIEKEIKERGYVLSTFGVGAHYNKEVLSNLADAGTGSYYHIKDVDEIGKYYAEEFGDMLDVALMHSKILVETDEYRTDSIKLYGYEQENNSYKVGTYYADETRDLLIEIKFNERKTDTFSIPYEPFKIKICLVAETPMGEVIEETRELKIRFGTEKESKDSENLEVCKFADEMTQVYMIKDADKLAAEGKYELIRNLHAARERNTHHGWDEYHRRGVMDDESLVFYAHAAEVTTNYLDECMSKRTNGSHGARGTHGATSMSMAFAQNIGEKAVSWVQNAAGGRVEKSMKRRSELKNLQDIKYEK